MNPTIITCYNNPDLDGFASAIAYSELLNKLGKHTRINISGIPRPETQFIADKFNVKFDNTSIKKDSKVILVDASEPHIINENIEIQNVIEVIDHRINNDAELFTNAKIQIELIGAAATLITEKFRENNIEPSEMSAKLLATAIISNTLNFKSTTKTL